VITNIGSRITRFRLIPKSTTLDDHELTLNGHYLYALLQMSIGAHDKQEGIGKPTTRPMHVTYVSRKKMMNIQCEYKNPP